MQRLALMNGPLAEKKADKPWYRLTNQAGQSGMPAELTIYDEIGFWGTSAQDFVTELRNVTATEINCRINSPGGEIFDGIAIMNCLRSHAAKVSVFVDSLAASIASVIAMAGDRVVMQPHSQLMIHDAMTGGWGNAGELRAKADLLDRQSDNIAAIYAGRAGGDTQLWRGRMLAETWYSAEEAVAAGLADEVAEPPERDEDVDALLRNRWDLSIFNYAGREHSPTPDVSRPAVPRIAAVACVHDFGTTEHPWAACKQCLAPNPDPPVSATLPADAPAPPPTGEPAAGSPLAPVAIDPDVLRAALRDAVKGPFEFSPEGFRATLESIASEAPASVGGRSAEAGMKPTAPPPAPEPPAPAPDPVDVLVDTVVTIAAEAPAVAAPPPPDPVPTVVPPAPEPAPERDLAAEHRPDVEPVGVATAPTPDPWVLARALQEASTR